MSVHPTAIVDPLADVDPTAVIGPYAVISGPVRIAAHVRLGPYVHVVGHTEIRAGCRVHAGAVIGDLPQDTAYRECDSYCRIDEGCVVREHVTIHRGTRPGSETRVGRECLIMAGAHVAHNCQVADRVIMANAALLAGHVEVGTRAFVSGGAVVHQFARIGESAMIQGNARVSHDIPPFMLADASGRVVSINAVGLRRAGFAREEIEEIRRAHRMLYRKHASFRRGVAELAHLVRTAPGHRLLQFVSADSRRGFAPRAHRARGLPAAAPAPHDALDRPRPDAGPVRELRIADQHA